MSGRGRLKGKKTLKVNSFLDEFEKDDIKKDVDIVELFHSFGVKLNKRGKSFTGLCPFHEETKPSLSVDREKGLFNCFGCGEAGDVFTVVEKLKGYSFPEALKYLKEQQSPGGVSVKAEPEPLSPPEKSTGTGKGAEPPMAVAADQTQRSKTAPPSPPQEGSQEEEKDSKEKETRKEGGTHARKEKGKSEKQDSTDTELPPLEGETKQGGNFKETETKRSKEKKPPTGKESILSETLLSRVTEHYHKRLHENKEALDYLKSRGLENTEMITRFQVGYADGTLPGMTGEEDKKRLTEIGIIREKSGAEHFKGYITFPIFSHDGRVTGMYGRSINPKAKLPHLYLKGKNAGVFNRRASVVYDEIILTESIIDALSLYSLEFLNTQAAYGVNGFSEDYLTILKDDRVKTVVIAFDRDERGNIAAEKVKELLFEAGIAVKRIVPPGVKDWNDYLLNTPDPKEIRERIDRAEVDTPDDFHFTVEHDSFKYVFSVGEMTYRLLGVKELFVTNLRVNIRAEIKGFSEFDNVDLYSARSRDSFANNLSVKLGVEAKRIERDLVRILEYLESERDKRLAGDKGEIPEMTEEERELGLSFLRSPDMFEAVSRDMEVLGYVGEDLNKKLMYIAASSRILDDPISVMILSQSASGKSMLVDTVKKLIPPEDVISLTSLSEQALNYVEDLEHKFLVMGEAVHSETIEHQVREMLSGKELSRMVTVKDAKTGEMTTKTVRKPVIVSAAMSSTNHRVNPENASRSFMINTDESKKQTRMIHEAQREKYTLSRYRTKRETVPEIIKKHHAAQRLLTKRVIVNPFGKYLDFPDTLMRTRRDHDRFIDLIACVCFLRQYRKEPKRDGEFEYIECDITDYEIAYEIMVSGVLASSLMEIPRAAIDLYEALREMAKTLAAEKDVEAHDVSFTQREIREHTGYGQSWIKQNLRILVEYEYVVMRRNADRGARGYYRIKGDESIQSLNLSMIPTPEDIRKILSYS